MPIYTPKELAETMQKRIAEGDYQPDDKLLVTIWSADDAQQWQDDATETDWAQFLSDLRGYELNHLIHEQAVLLSEWWEERLDIEE